MTALEMIDKLKPLTEETEGEDREVTAARSVPMSLIGSLYMGDAEGLINYVAEFSKAQLKSLSYRDN